MNPTSRLFMHAVLSMDKIAAERILHENRERTGAADWVETVVSPALEEIGSDWERGDLALSQVYTASRICEDLVTRLMPSAANDTEGPIRTAIVVLDDYHMLGKRIVHSVVRASGIAILDYGRLDADELVRRTRADGVRVLLISTLMLPAALAVKDVKTRLGDDVKLLVGGAPYRLDDQLWREVGADGVGRNSADAVRALRKLLEATR
jgi:trimethylamine corrinoid protein